LSGLQKTAHKQTFTAQEKLTDHFGKQPGSVQFEVMPGRIETISTNFSDPDLELKVRRNEPSYVTEKT